MTTREEVVSHKKMCDTIEKKFDKYLTKDHKFHEVEENEKIGECTRLIVELRCDTFLNN